MTDPLDPEDQTPASRNAELALLAACLESKGARATARRHLTHEDFYWPDHALVYQATNALDRAGRMVETITGREALVGDVAVTEVGRISQLVVDLVVQVAHPDHAADHAAIIRAYSLRRKAVSEGRRLIQRAMSPAEDPGRLVTDTVTRLQGIRDVGTDVTALSLGDLMETRDEPPKWVIPGLMESQDRMILTGSEGLGKSALQRQIAIMAAAGLQPFSQAVIPPVRTLIVDLENKPHQVRNQSAPLLDWLRNHGADDPRQRVLLDTPGRINVLRDRDLGKIHQTIDTFAPDLVILGPIYRAAPHSLNGDDEAAPFLTAMDTITERGCALILEAHAGKSNEGVGKGAQRDLRPRGSAALIGWPEFGLALRGIGGGLADLEPWRGGREQRQWPSRLRRAPGNRWEETYPDDRPPRHDRPPPVEDPQAAMI